MIQHEHSVIINRSVEDVFSFVADHFFENQPKWAPDVEESHQTSPGPVGVGAKGQLVRVVNGAPTDSEVTITEYEPNKKFAFASTGPMNAEGQYAFSAVDGGTKLDLMVHMPTDGVLPLMVPMINRVVQANVQTGMETIKTMLDT